ncbi:MAG: hypothetical protein R3B49_07440 [Phycisphaerales bacterium]
MPSARPAPAPSPAGGGHRTPDHYATAESPIARTQPAPAQRSASGASAPLLGPRGLVGVSANDLRRAIVLREVLGPPVALRD